jgi:hypothetical protein
MQRLLAPLFLVLLLAPASGTVLEQLTIEKVESRAESILVATVKGKSEFAGAPPGCPILTEVEFDSLVVLKGDDPGATVSYRFAGGRLGGKRLAIAGMPEFEIGERYVLFLAPDLDRLCPIVGWWQGRYRVLPALPGAEPVVADSAGRPVYGFTNGLPVLTPPDEEAKPLTLPAFTGLVKELARQRELRGKEGSR